VEDTCTPRIHVFLWLLTNDKILTRDNLSKRKKLNDLTCLFSENESVNHLFFGCCVSRFAWENLSEILNISIGHDFESVAKFWLHDKKYRLINLCTSAML
jgi:hypothetical protein